MALRAPLDPSVAQRIGDLAKAGRAARAAGDMARAEELFLAAWAGLPEPRTSWDTTPGFIRYLIEFYRDTGRPDDARKWLAMFEEHMSDYAQVDRDILAGTVLHEAGELDAAYKRLRAAYEAFKTRPFQGLDPKHLKFAKSDGP